MPEEIEKKTKFVGYKAKPSHKQRIEDAVKNKLVPDVRNTSELVERLVDKGLDDLSHGEAV